MTKIIKLLLRVLLIGACLVYAFWGVDWVQFGVALKGFGLLSLVVSFLYSFVTYIPLALRFRYLTGNAIGFWVSLKASIFCLGVNNMLPAKLGEVAKVFYLRRKSEISLGQGLGMVFWERFADLNCLLGMGVVSAVALKSTMALIPLVTVVGGLWVFVLLFRFFPATATWAVKLVPTEQLRLLCSEVIHQLQARMRPGFFSILSGWTLLFWLGNLSVSLLVLLWVGHLDLPFTHALSVFVFVTLGFAMPSSPGGLGVVEAAFVLSLGLFGVPKAEALALALFFRFISYVPPTLGALYVMTESGLSFKNIRESSGESL